MSLSQVALTGAVMPAESERDDTPKVAFNPVDAWNDAASDPLARAYVSPLDAALVPPYAADVTDGADEQPLPPAVVATIATIPPRVWAPILYVVAVLLCISAAFDVLNIYTPGIASNSRWRFSMIGAATPKLLKVTVAAALVTLGVAYSERRRLAYCMGGILSVAAVALFSVVPLFLLDALQVRLVLPEKLTGSVFVANVSFAVALLVAMSLVTLLCGLMLFKVGRWLTLDLNSADAVATRVWDR